MESKTSSRGHAQTTQYLRERLLAAQQSLGVCVAAADVLRVDNRALRAALSIAHGRIKCHAGGSAAMPKMSVEHDVAVKRPARVDADAEHLDGDSTARRIYVSAMTDVPLQVLGDKQIPANILLSSDAIEIVQTVARIQPHTLVEITSSAAPKAASKTPSGLLMCCFSPSATPSSSSAYVLEDGQGELLNLSWQEGIIKMTNSIEGSIDMKRVVKEHTAQWAGADVSPVDARMALKQSFPGGAVLATCLTAKEPKLNLAGSPSHLLSSAHAGLLVNVVPPLQQLSPWQLMFSTKRDGMSLATLFRRCFTAAPTLLVIRDTAGHLFGCYTDDGWRISGQFYGTGRTCVFQLEPHRLMYPWNAHCAETNDFFQLGVRERLVVGGSAAGAHSAIVIDEDLLKGSSGMCTTFGSPCLASCDEFTVQHVEVWQVLKG